MTLMEKIREYAESNRPFRLHLSDTRILGTGSRIKAAVTTLHDQLVDDGAARTFWRRASLRSATSAIVLLQEQITPLSWPTAATTCG